MNRKIVYFVMTALAAFLVTENSMLAESAEDRAARKHEIRIGWGDQMFETLCWHENANAAGLNPSIVNIIHNENYHYTQHWFADYQYRVNCWFGFGGMVDFSGVSWDEATYSGGGELWGNQHHHFYNISVMPTCQFTYFNSKYVSLHSGLGAGVNINTGDEIDVYDRTTEVVPGFYFNPFGVKVNYDRYFATVDLGGMFAVKNKNMAFLIGSRMFSVGIGINF